MSQASPAGDYHGTVRHGEGASHHVLQGHREVQASQDHHLQGWGVTGTVPSRSPAQAYGH